MLREDAFRVLGLRPDATPEDIKRAYRRLAQSLHPDKVASEDVEAAHDAMADLNAAYVLLTGEDAAEEERLAKEITDLALRTIRAVLAEALGRDELAFNVKSTSILHLALDRARGAVDRMQSAVKANEQRVAKVKQQLLRYKRKEGANLIQEVLEHEVAEGEKAVADWHRQAKLGEAMIKYLEEYEDTKFTPKAGGEFQQYTPSCPPSEFLSYFNRPW